MELYPYQKDDYPAIEDMYTATDKFTGKEFPCGYMIEDNKLYLPRGTQVSKIEEMCNVKANYINESDPLENMDKNHYSLYDPRDKIQEESINFLQEENHQAALNLQTGLGKAQPNDTMIPTPNGYTLMGNIKPGDYVFGRNGNPIKVLEIFPQPEKLLVYEIIFKDGRTAKCCKDHLWNIWLDNKWTTVTMNDIIKLFLSGKNIFIPKLINSVNYGTYATAADPFDVGQMISSDTKENDDITYLDKYPEFINQFLYNSPIIRLNLLRGILEKYCELMWENGIYKIKYHTINIIIMHIIKNICYSMNFECIVKDKINKFNTEFNIFISAPMPIINFLIGSTNGMPSDDVWKYIFNDDILLQITDIEALDKEDCTCIKVDAEDQLYLTEDFIVTHNTFCVAYASTKLCEKTLIITPNESLKHQWINTYSKMFDYRNKSLMNIAGSNIIEGIMEDNIESNADVYFVNHQTLRSYMTQYGGYKLHQFFKKINIGIKVYDESHMEFANILLLDFFSNTNRTWYLTATFDRSDKTESQCFKRAFNSVLTYGEMESQEVVEKHVIYHVVNINSRITPRDRSKLMNSFQGFTAANYGKYAFQTDENKTAYKAILEILNITKTLEGKTIIFVPLIDVVDQVVKDLKKDFPDKSVAAYHSRCSKDEKESAEKKDIIVSTIKSCGTGKDIKGLRVVICAEPIASKVVAQQLMGRLRPYAKDKETYFFDVLDISIPAINWWFRARYKKYQELCKKTVYLNMDK